MARNGVYIYPTHSPYAGFGQFLNIVLLAWIQSFPSPRLVAKVKETKLPYNLHIAGDRRDGFVPFAIVSAQRETQRASYRIWTLVTDFISYGDNCSAKRTSTKKLCIKSKGLIWRKQISFSGKRSSFLNYVSILIIKGVFIIIGPPTESIYESIFIFENW